MKITIINGERPEKRYSRVEIADFVEQLRNGTYRLENTSRDSRKEVCFAAEWHKQQGELKVRCINQLILLTLENLRDLATVREYKEQAARQLYTLLCFIGDDGHSLNIVCPFNIEHSAGQMAVNVDNEQSSGFNEHCLPNAFRKLHYIYSTQLGTPIADHEPTLATSCLTSYDPHPYYNPSALAINVSDAPEDTPQFRITQEDIGTLFSRLRFLIDGDTIVLAGHIPPSLPSDMYEQILEFLKGRRLRVIVDAEKELLTGTLKYHPWLIKPNRDELGDIFGVLALGIVFFRKFRHGILEIGQVLEEFQIFLYIFADAGIVLFQEFEEPVVGVFFQPVGDLGEFQDRFGVADSGLCGFFYFQPGKLLQEAHFLLDALLTETGGAPAVRPARFVLDAVKVQRDERAPKIRLRFVCAGIGVAVRLEGEAAVLESRDLAGDLVDQLCLGFAILVGGNIVFEFLHLGGKYLVQGFPRGLGQIGRRGDIGRHLVLDGFGLFIRRALQFFHDALKHALRLFARVGEGGHGIAVGEAVAVDIHGSGLAYAVIRRHDHVGFAHAVRM